MSTVIRTSNLTKNFGTTRALDGLDLEVTQGEVLGFLGPNGAGKSTTLRILLGQLRKSGGDAEVFGSDPWSKAVSLHQRIAYVPGDVELWPNLTGGEVIDFMSRLRKRTNPEKRKELTERFELDPRKKCRTYSKGNRQKVALIAALSADVDLLLLDEPTAGLDPLMEAVFQQCIAEAKEQGKTVLLSSHILAQVEVLADRISIVRDGRIVETGTISDLRHLSRTSVAVELATSSSGLADLPGVYNFHEDEGRTCFEVDGTEMDAVLRELSARGIISLTATPPTLEQLLLSYYGTIPGQRA